MSDTNKSVSMVTSKSKYISCRPVLSSSHNDIRLNLQEKSHKNSYLLQVSLTCKQIELFVLVYNKCKT